MAPRCRRRRTSGTSGPASNFDILVRWLRASGYQVTFCRNVTDIDDKILRSAAGEGVPWWAVAQRNERAFSRAYDVLGCLPPDVEPRATGHVPEMIALMRRLIDSGHAYAAGGDVYFDVSSYPEYGALSGQRLEHMRPAEDTETADAKRDPRDFALWKGAKPGEPSWETPWGLGRPGLAPGMLGDGHHVPRRDLRHPRRRRWTWSSRTTRTSWPSPARPATGSPGTGCTTAWSGWAARR